MKKTILAVTTALLMTAAYADPNYNSTSDYGTGSGWDSNYRESSMGTGQSADAGNDTHMIESNVDSLIRGAYSFDKSKNRGSSADNDSQADLVLNYAFKFHDRWQFGTRLNYLHRTAQLGDQENYGFQLGLFYNFSENLMQSFYLSLFSGLEWQRTYGSSAGNPRDEVWKTTFAAGKRFTLARWNIAHLVYSPEIALVTAKSTTGTNVEYSQNIQLRFLQFSLFF